MNKGMLDSLEEKGPAEVLREMAQGKHGSAPDSPNRQDVEAWLRAKEVEAKELASTRRDEREEATLSIAKEALSIAKEANRIASEDLEAVRSSSAAAERQARWAKWAAVIATVAAVAATGGQITKLIAFFAK
jgi:arsenate reductase-like glutaredoxin family protein